MADRITDEAFDAMPLSQQLEFVASHLHDADEASVGNLKCWDITKMLMHSLVMSRKAVALERELARYRDDERLSVLRLEIALEQAEDEETNVLSWQLIARKVRLSVHGRNTPKGAA